MSINALTSTLSRTDLEPVSKLILLVLADHAHPDGTGAYPSKATIARLVPTSVDTVKRRIRSMLDAGVITLGDQALVSHFRPDRRPTVYDITDVSEPVDNSATRRGNLHPRPIHGGADGYGTGVQIGPSRGCTAVHPKPKDNPRDKPRGGARVVTIHPQVDSRPLCPACDRPIALASGQTVHESGLCIQCRSGS